MEKYMSINIIENQKASSLLILGFVLLPWIFMTDYQD
jgi:hypothetical protein